MDMSRFSLRTFTTVVPECGIPIAWEKTSQDSTTSLTFYGAHLDTQTMQVSLPQDKLASYTQLITETLGRNSVTVKELQSLIGKLQFATCAVTGGRLFLRRLHDLLTQLPRKYKPYWHIRITQSARKDLQMWHTFLINFNGITIIQQPSVAESNALNLYTDASDYGYGGCYGSSWVVGQWPVEWTQHQIAVRELYPIMAIINTVGEKLRNSRIMFHCDNQAIVAVINKQSSKDGKIMSLLRPLVLALLLHNISFRASYISTHENIIADFLSRTQVTPTFLREHSLKPYPEQIRHHLLPENLKL